MYKYQQKIKREWLEKSDILYITLDDLKVKTRKRDIQNIEIRKEHYSKQTNSNVLGTNSPRSMIHNIIGSR